MSSNNPFEKDRRKMQLRQATKKSVRGTKMKKTRKKDWSDVAYDDWDDYEDMGVQRIMPRGEQERRKAVEAVIKGQEQPSTVENIEIDVEGTNAVEGMVIETFSGGCRVSVGKETLKCTFRGALKAQETGFTNLAAAGDRVVITRTGETEGVVEAVQPRTNYLARPDVFYSHLQQVLVANIDWLLIVASWREPKIWTELIDRYLIVAELQNLSPVLCINKIDLLDDQDAVDEVLAPYREMGIRIILASAETGTGLDELRHLLKDKTTVLSGLSGVGKSSILTAIQPNLDLRVSEVSTTGVFRGLGTHTTTQSTLYQLDIGGAVVDTPGIKEFGLAKLRRDELIAHYPALAALAGGCRFNDCSHIEEPDCRVKAAVKAGEVNPDRYKNYAVIYHGLPS